MLKFIGLGSAFNTTLANTSAYIRKDDSMILIDCGGTTFHRLGELKLLDGLKQLNIIITHTHPDHVGSLGDVVFYVYYVLNIIPKIHFPKADWMKTLLKYMGVKPDMFEMVNALEVSVPCDEIDFKRLRFIPVPHSSTLPAFGFSYMIAGKQYFYSGDSSGIPESVMNDLKSQKLEAIYQDTCGLDYDGNVHLSINKLCELIPEELRKKVNCIHHDSFLDLDEVRALGFTVPEVE